MKKMTTILLLIFIVLCSTNIAQAKFLQEKRYASWISGILSVGDTTLVRIVSPDDAGDAFFTVDFYPDACNTGVIRIGVSVRDMKDAEIGNFTGSAQVDSNKTYDISYRAYARSNVVFFDIKNLSGNQILKDSAHGSFIKFKINTPDTPMYVNFPLQGFKKAYERSGNLCTTLNDKKSKSQHSDAKYFKK